MEDKVFKFRGKTLEDLQKLSEEEFVAMLPSDLRRKVKRGYTSQEQIFLNNFKKGGNNLKTHCRELFITPQMVGKKISIYNGKEFVQIHVLEEMLGLRFGELAPTRKGVVHPGNTGGAAKGGKE